MEYHDIGEKFEYEGVMLEVQEAVRDNSQSYCSLCYFGNNCKPNNNKCTPYLRPDGKNVFYKLVEQCKTKDNNNMKRIIYFADLTPCDDMMNYKEAAFVPEFVNKDTEKFDTQPPLKVVQVATTQGWCIVAKWSNNGSTRVYAKTKEAVQECIDILHGACDSGDCYYAFGEEKIHSMVVTDGDIGVFDGYTPGAVFQIMERENIKVKAENTDKVFATSEVNDLKLEDLKDGDFVAFDYNGNTAVTKLVSDKGDFMYAVGLWHDSNLVGKEDAIWYADNINDVNSVEPITNLHYASISEVMRYMRVISEDWEREKRRLLKDEIKTLFECQTTEDYIGNLTDSLRKTLVAKDHDYNSAFSEMFDELGIDYAYGKLREKINHINVLRKQPNMVENEGLEDALLDTAGYAILTLVELKKRKK